MADVFDKEKRSWVMSRVRGKGNLTTELSALRSSGRIVSGGQSYGIEVSSNLGDWETIEKGVAGTGGVIGRFCSKEEAVERFFQARRNQALSLG